MRQKTRELFDEATKAMEQRMSTNTATRIALSLVFQLKEEIEHLEHELARVTKPHG